MADPNRALFESVVRLLAPVLDELIFVGGCTTASVMFWNTVVVLNFS